MSFDERQKKQKQRKSLCAKGKPGCLLMKDFSRGHPALAKNAARPCAAPSGSADVRGGGGIFRSGRLQTRTEAHTSELQSLMRISYAVLCLQKKTNNRQIL